MIRSRVVAGWIGGLVCAASGCIEAEKPALIGADGGVADAAPEQHAGDVREADGIAAAPDGGAWVPDGEAPQPPDSGGPEPVDTGDSPREPVELLVYTANVENLPRTSDGCPGDWRDLFSYMTVQPQKPDVFFVQQLSDATQLGELTAYMTANLGRPYDGVIAEANPTPFNSPCGAQKEKQTNALVFATDRLQRVGEPTIWQSYRNVDGACELDPLSRTRGIASALRDTASGAVVAAASIHWSTRNGAGADPACAVANARHTDQVFRVHYPDAALVVFGGDTNEPDTDAATASAPYTGWYAETNGGLGGALGFVDPIWSGCDAAGNLRQCLLDNWTFSGAAQRRIDFLFARGATLAVLDVHTVTFNEAGDADRQLTGTDSAVGYSDHRAVWSRLRY